MRLFSSIPSISPREAARRLAAGELQLVDVRQATELARARVPAAKHIPLRSLSSQLAHIDRDRPVAFVCHSGSRSAIATRSALKAGLDAVNVRGGISAWTRAGLPLAS